MGHVQGMQEGLGVWSLVSKGSRKTVSISRLKPDAVRSLDFVLDAVRSHRRVLRMGVMFLTQVLQK